MKLLIKDGVIITMNGDSREYKVGSVAVDGDTIIHVGGIPSDFIPEKIIDAAGKIVMPGLVNSHTHTAMSLFRHNADDLPFWEWLHDRIFPLEDALTPADAYWGSMLSIAEMIRSGTTTFADMYFFMEETARAVIESGIRASLSRGLVSGDDENDKLEKGVALYENWHGKGGGRINVDLGPHAPYTCTPEYLGRIAKAAEELKINIHTHLSESRKEIETIQEQYGLSPVEYMEKTGLFRQHTYAAHCVYVSDKDIGILKRNGVSVLNNPGSNFKLGNGFAPVDALIKAGINVSLGTDGPASNNNLNMFEEISLAALVNKAVTEDPTAVPAYEALKMATLNGAMALGRESEIGSLEEGKKADIIMVDTCKPHFHPIGNPYSSLVYSAQGNDVCTVICNGKILMEDYRLLTVDEREIMEKSENIAGRMLEKSN